MLHIIDGNGNDMEHPHSWKNHDANRFLQAFLARRGRKVYQGPQGQLGQPEQKVPQASVLSTL